MVYTDSVGTDRGLLLVSAELTDRACGDLMATYGQQVTWAIGQVTAPPQEPRHSACANHVLAIAICAVLSGAGSFLTTAYSAQRLPQDLLKRLRRRRRNDATVDRIPPSEPSTRRTLAPIDAEALDQVSHTFLLRHGTSGSGPPGDGRLKQPSRSYHTASKPLGQRWRAMPVYEAPYVSSRSPASRHAEGDVGHPCHPVNLRR